MDVLQDFGEPLHRYLMHRLANAQSAQDVAQEAYLRLMRLEHPELVREPKAYLFRVASSILYELKRREHREVVTFDSQKAEFAAGYVGDSTAMDPGEQIAIQQQLQAVLDQLPPLHASILVMKKHDGLSMQEIACSLDISIHTVKKYLFLAIAHVRTKRCLA